MSFERLVRMKSIVLLSFALVALSVWGCSSDDGAMSTDENAGITEIKDPGPINGDMAKFTKNGQGIAATYKGRKITVLMAEYLTTESADEAGRTVHYAVHGNKQLGGDFVPDVNYQVDGSLNVSYYVDQNRPCADLGVGATSASIDRAMASWDRASCSDLGMTKIPSSNAVTTGFISFILGYGGSFDVTADIVHCGWMSGAFFNELAPNGSTNILGVTFTLVWTDNEGNLTDVDKNGQYDVAFREIYYNDNFAWHDQDGQKYDVEWVALHEAGHGLSQDHFGSRFVTNSNGKRHYAPLAVMNPAYNTDTPKIGETDLAGHCSLWAMWPKK
jgi:hypothetical protein